MEDNMNDEIAGAIEKVEATKEKLKTDPDAVRKLLAGAMSISEDVTVYPNKELNREVAEFDQKLRELARSVTKLDDETDDEYTVRTSNFLDDYNAALAEFDALKERLAESGVTFHLVSIGKKAVKNLRTAARKKFPLEDSDADIDEQRDDYYRASIVAAHLVADGYNIDDVLNIMDNWPMRCWAELWSAAQKLSIADDYLGDSLTPDF
jgi:hypothetical protein